MPVLVSELDSSGIRRLRRDLTAWDKAGRVERP